MEQPKGFEDPHLSKHVYKLKKALFGLKQAPRAWYDRLTRYLFEIDYLRGNVDKNLFVKYDNSELFVDQIYVYDIVFGSTNAKMVKYCVHVMSSEFEMSVVGELNYFLGFQVKK